MKLCHAIKKRMFRKSRLRNKIDFHHELVLYYQRTQNNILAAMQRTVAEETLVSIDLKWMREAAAKSKECARLCVFHAACVNALTKQINTP